MQDQPMRRPAVMAVGVLLALSLIPLGLPGAEASEGYVSAHHMQTCNDDDGALKSDAPAGTTYGSNNRSFATPNVAPVAGSPPNAGATYTCVQTQLWWVLGPIVSVVPDYVITNPLGETPVLFEVGAIILRDAQACPKALYEHEVDEVLDFQCMNDLEQQVVFDDVTPAGCVPRDEVNTDKSKDKDLYDVEVAWEHNPAPLNLIFFANGHMSYNGFPSPYWTGTITGAYPATFNELMVHVGVDQHRACTATNGLASADPMSGQPVNATLSDLWADGVEDITYYEGFEF